MGIEDLKFRLASQYVQSGNGAKTEDTKAKKQEKADEVKNPQTKEVGDRLLTEDPKMAVMKDLGFIQAGGIKTTPEAVIGRAQTYFETAPEMAALNEMFGIETARPYNVKGVDNDKLDKYLARGLSEESTQGFLDFADRLAALG